MAALKAAEALRAELIKRIDPRTVEDRIVGVDFHSRARRASMTQPSTRLADVFAAIDAANAHDPSAVLADGGYEPAALVDGRRMSEELGRLAPNASELLRIAVRGHHIERRTSPRLDYPAGRVGYLKWRKDLAAFHARRLAAVMAAAGYSPEEIERVGVGSQGGSGVRPRGADARRCVLFGISRAWPPRFYGQDRRGQARPYPRQNLA